MFLEFYAVGLFFPLLWYKYSSIRSRDFLQEKNYDLRHTKIAKLFVFSTFNTFENGSKIRVALAQHFEPFSGDGKTWKKKLLFQVGNTLSDKIRRTKLSKFQLGIKNFVRGKALSVENFVQYFNTKVRQKLAKNVEISAWCRKFCPTKYFVRRKFCPTKFCPIR